VKAPLLFLLLGWSLLACVSADAHAGGSNGVVRIDIDSAWGGLGRAQETKVGIVRTAEGYRRDGAPLPDKAVNDLLAAMREPSLDQPALANLGIDQAWLEAHSTPDASRDSRLPGRSPAQIALYKARFADPKVAARLVREIYSPQNFHTDDYPHLTVTLTFEDGSTAVLDSLSQQNFMLPWSITVKGRETVTWNADIARAISALLPPGAANAGRVSGAGLAGGLSEQLLFEIQDDWNMLDSQNRAPASIALLKSAYDVRTAEVSDRHHVDYVSSGESGIDEVFEATLSRRDFPKSFTVTLQLPFDKGNAEGVDRFLATNAPRENLVLSLPRLMQALRRHPDVPAQLLYVHGASLSETALTAFTADMHALGEDKLAARVAALREHAVLLVTDTFEETAWIVLPDRSTVLWHYGNDAGLLDWPAADFPARPCKITRLFSDTGGCVGAVISSSGKIEK
jgi:hypothetical protein